MEATLKLPVISKCTAFAPPRSAKSRSELAFNLLQGNTCSWSRGHVSCLALYLPLSYRLTSILMLNGGLVHCWAALLIAFQIEVYGCRTSTQLAAEGTA